MLGRDSGVFEEFQPKNGFIGLLDDYADLRDEFGF